MSKQVDPATPELTAEQPGRYQLKELLAEGGQSRVWRAWDAHLGREVAFKQPIETGISSHRTVDRFLREARITARLEHPNIVPVYEIGRRADGSHYCTQKLVRGPDGVGPARTLSEALAGAKTLAERLELLPHFARLCYAVAHAHEQGIVHRDVKPANVLIGGLGETVLADWGLAKVGPDRPIAGEPTTAGGAVIGTPVYRSPEQSMGQAVDERSDVWSLGVVLYELLTGRPPIGTIAGGLAESDLPSALLEEPNAPKELAAIAEKALRVRRGDRYRSAASMSADVAAFLSGTRVAVYDYSALELARLFFTRHKTVAAALTVGVVLVTISSVVFWQQWLAIRKESAEKRVNLSARLVKDAREAEIALEWDRASALYALARLEHETPAARWGATLAANRTVPQVVRTQLPAGILALAWRPGGKELAIGGTDGVIRLMDANAVETRALRAHAGSVAGLSYSPDGTLLVSAGHDRRAYVWNLVTGAAPVKILEVKELLNAVEFSPDGTSVAIATEQGRVDLVDPRDGTVLRTLRAPGSKEPPIYSVVFAEGGAVVAAGTWDNRLLLWETATGKLRADIDTSPGSRPPTASVLGIAVSADGSTIVTSARDRALRLWRVADGTAITRLDGHTGKVYGVSFSPDGAILASGGADGTIRLWDVGNSQPLVGASFGLGDDVRELGFSPDGSLLAWGTDTGAVGVRKMEAIAIPPAGAYRVYALGFSPDGTRLLHGDRSDLVLESVDGTRRTFTLRNTLQMLAEFTPDGRSVAAHCEAQEVCFLDLVTGKETKRFQTSGKNALALALAPDGSLVAIAGTESPVIRVYDANTGVHVRDLEGHENTIFALAWSPDGRTLASGSYDMTIALWNPATGERTARLEGHSHGIRRLAFSPDGATLASASWDKTVRLWDVASKTLLRRLEGHEDHVFGVAFSPDGTWLASTSWDGTLRVWSSADGKELARFVSDESRIHSVAISRDGKSIVYAGLTTHQLNLADPGDPEAALEKIAAASGLDRERLRLAGD